MGEPLFFPPLLRPSNGLCLLLLLPKPTLPPLLLNRLCCNPSPPTYSIPFAGVPCMDSSCLRIASKNSPASTTPSPFASKCVNKSFNWVLDISMSKRCNARAGKKQEQDKQWWWPQVSPHLFHWSTTRTPPPTPPTTPTTPTTTPLTQITLFQTTSATGVHCTKGSLQGIHNLTKQRSFLFDGLHQLFNGWKGSTEHRSKTTPL